MTKNILLIGGGVDSVTLALDLHHKGIEFELLHVDYGQVAALAEIEFISKLAKDLNVPIKVALDEQIDHANPKPNKILDGAAHDNPYILGRNYYLLGVAASKGDNIYIGLSEGRIFDCTEEFVNNMNLAWKGAFDGQKKVIAPYVNNSKKDLVALGYSLSPKYFEYVMSCWTPLEVKTRGKVNSYKPCGVCNHCKELSDYSEGLI
jgi:7-cyano-7-deazaguanine synthase in queuosine biosynthesis